MANNDGEYALADRSWSKDPIKARKVGRDYLDGTLTRNTWQNFHHGLAAVHELGALAHEANILKALSRNFPNPATTREVCDRQVYKDIRTAKEIRSSAAGGTKEEVETANLEAAALLSTWVPDTRNKTNVLNAVCDAAINWTDVERAITKCPSPEEDITNVCCIAGKGMKRFSKTNPCSSTIDHKDCVNVKGLGLKGADMAMLLQGCEVPVPDKWMIWHMAGKVEPKMDRGPRPKSRIAEEEGEEPDKGIGEEVTKIQRDPKRYDLYRKAIIEQARSEDMTVGEFHTGVWLDLITCKTANADGACTTGNEETAFSFIQDLKTLP